MLGRRSIRYCCIYKAVVVFPAQFAAVRRMALVEHRKRTKIICPHTNYRKLAKAVDFKSFQNGFFIASLTVPVRIRGPCAETQSNVLVLLFERTPLCELSAMCDLD